MVSLFLFGFQGAEPVSFEGLDKGNHGYDNDVEDMRPVFMAAGPDFKQDYSFSDTFLNTNVYPLMTRLLRIGGPETNGSYDQVSHLVRHEIPKVYDSSGQLSLPSILSLLFGEFGDR